jgi:RNA polymerase sigma-70 factor (ECF subfamily)
LSDASERSLVKAAQDGSERAVEELFRRYWAKLYRAAHLIVRDGAAAEDIAQDAFLSALGALDRFDRRRPFAPWLHRIAVNRAIDWSRSRSLRREVSALGQLPDPVAPEVLPGGELGPTSEIGVALAKLSAEHRAVVVLRYVLDYSPGEIARMLDLPRGTVNSRLRRALDQLSERLEVESG